MPIDLSSDRLSLPFPPAHIYPDPDTRWINPSLQATNPLSPHTSSPYHVPALASPDTVDAADTELGNVISSLSQDRRGWSWFGHRDNGGMQQLGKGRDGRRWADRDWDMEMRVWIETEGGSLLENNRESEMVATRGNFAPTDMGGIRWRIDAGVGDGMDLRQLGTEIQTRPMERPLLYCPAHTQQPQQPQQQQLEPVALPMELHISDPTPPFHTNNHQHGLDLVGSDSVWNTLTPPSWAHSLEFPSSPSINADGNYSPHSSVSRLVRTGHLLSDTYHNSIYATEQPRTPVRIDEDGCALLHLGPTPPIEPYVPPLDRYNPAKEGTRDNTRSPYAPWQPIPVREFEMPSMGTTQVALGRLAMGWNAESDRERVAKWLAEVVTEEIEMKPLRDIPRW